MQTIDLILQPRWIVPIRPARQVLEGYAIAIHAGRILAIDTVENISSTYQAESVQKLSSHVLMPGLINMHGHQAMSLFRGLADDLPLMTWLNDHIWPAEGRWVSPEFCQTGVKLAAAEMIRGGTTTFSDMYFFPEVTAQVALEAGLRCQIAFPILDFPTPWGQGPDEYLEKGVALAGQYADHPAVQVALGPHAPYTVSDQPLREIIVAARQHGLPIQIHLHETAFEVEEAVRTTGQRPTERLAELGILGESTQCVHMTQINDRDLQLLTESKSHIIHCPHSNQKLASGFCPVQRLQEAGLNVALGTDGAASNNALDMLNEMQTAARTAKAVAGDASAVDAFTALEMATINGARALGQEQSLGSLEPGKWADMIAIDLGALELQPVYNPVSHLAYAVRASHVSHSWVAARPLLENGQLTTLDSGAILNDVLGWQHKLAANQ